MTSHSDDKGLWGIDSPEQLFKKLRSDFARMEAAPRDPYPAFDFFTTAYHMYEWVGEVTPARRKALESEPLLRVAGHIATRAKHLTAKAEKWIQLVSTETRERGPLGRTPAGKPTALRVILSDATMTPLGQMDVTAIQLAQCLLERWQRWFATGT